MQPPHNRCNADDILSSVSAAYATRFLYRYAVGNELHNQRFSAIRRINR